MDFQHASDCPHCHRQHSRIELATIPVAPLTNPMRQGPWQEPTTGLVIGTDEWRRVRCVYCQTVMVTPLEAIPPLLCRSDDGTYLGVCGPCGHDIVNDRPPGTTQSRWRN